jgi:hypothetical protein
MRWTLIWYLLKKTRQEARIKETEGENFILYVCDTNTLKIKL